MSKRSIEELVAEIDSSSGANAAGKIREYLRTVRDQRIRDSDSVALYGAQLLRDHSSSLKQEEFWLTVEQVLMAALDCGSLKLAASLLLMVENRFGTSSVRAGRLLGMFKEATGNFDEAKAHYEELLKDNPENGMLLKRLVAVEAGRGNTAAAMELLRKYLDTHMTDAQGWEELAALYVQAQMYQQAAFCYEELLLHAPGTEAYHLQYADILYTVGGATGANYRTARAYYASALQLSDGKSVRALYGITSCTAQLAGLKGRSAEDGNELAELAAQALVAQYSEAAPDKLPYVKQLLEAQGLGGSAS